MAFVSLVPIRRLKAHYFAIYAIFGCVTPYLPVYLRDLKGLSPAAIGDIFAAGQAAVLIMPVVITYLADRYRWVRPLQHGLFGLNAVAMVALFGAVGFWSCLLLVAVSRMATQPQIALADGLYFSLQADPGQPRADFASVRVWGTLGFILPSIVIFASYPLGGGLTWMPWVTVVAALLGALNARSLPWRMASPPGAVNRAPTRDALRILLQPRLALFCLGVGCVIFSNMAFYGFYPLYLTSEVGIGERWIGPISSLGVTLEILFVLGLERMRRRIGFGGLLALGGAASVFRLACLAWLPTPFFAVFFQVFHGLTVVGFLIVPVMVLNTFASEGCRNSVQGLYVMLVSGLFSIAGNLVSGRLAEVGLLTLYRVALAVCMLGLILIAASYLRRRPAVAGDASRE